MEKWITEHWTTAIWWPGTCQSEVYIKNRENPQGLVARITKGGEELSYEDVQGALGPIRKTLGFKSHPEAVNWEL